MSDFVDFDAYENTPEEEFPTQGDLLGQHLGVASSDIPRELATTDLSLYEDDGQKPVKQDNDHRCQDSSLPEEELLAELVGEGQHDHPDETHSSTATQPLHTSAFASIAKAPMSHSLALPPQASSLNRGLGVAYTRGQCDTAPSHPPDHLQCHSLLGQMMSHGPSAQQPRRSPQPQQKATIPTPGNTDTRTDP